MRLCAVHGTPFISKLDFPASWSFPGYCSDFPGKQCLRRVTYLVLLGQHSLQPAHSLAATARIQTMTQPFSSRVCSLYCPDPFCRAKENAVWAFKCCQIPSKKTLIFEENCECFSLKFAYIYIRLRTKFSEKSEEKYLQILPKILELLREIWQRLKVHTAFFLSTAALPAGTWTGCKLAPIILFVSISKIKLPPMCVFCDGERINRAELIYSLTYTL